MMRQPAEIRSINISKNISLPAAVSAGSKSDRRLSAPMAFTSSTGELAERMDSAEPELDVVITDFRRGCGDGPTGGAGEWLIEGLRSTVAVTAGGAGASFGKGANRVDVVRIRIGSEILSGAGSSSTAEAIFDFLFSFVASLGSPGAMAAAGALTSAGFVSLSPKRERIFLKEVDFSICLLIFEFQTSKAKCKYSAPQKLRKHSQVSIHCVLRGTIIELKITQMLVRPRLTQGMR